MSGTMSFEFSGEEIADAPSPEPTPVADAADGVAAEVVDQPAGDETPTPTTPLEVPEVPTVSLKDSAFRDSLLAEYSKDGKLSDASLAKLESAGIPQDIVEDYLASKTAASAAQIEATNRQIFKACGGPEAVQEALQWAAKNLDKTTIETIDKQLREGGAAVAINAIKGLQAQAGIGGGVAVVPGATGNQSAVLPFRDDSEFEAAIQDPRYSTSPAFRAEVAKRLAGAMKAGKISTNNVVIH